MPDSSITKNRSTDTGGEPKEWTGIDRRQEMREWRGLVDAKLAEGARTMQALHLNLAENTTATQQVKADVEGVKADTGEVVGLLNSAKGAFLVLEKIGSLARPLGYIAMAGSAFWGLFSVVKGGGASK